jgi:protein-S-isoprenylcysteine O-methyltransferase Ste14
LYKAATSRSRLWKTISSITAIFLFMGIMVLLIIAAPLVDKAAGFPKLVPPLTGNIVSIPLLIIGLGLWLWCILCFLIVKGTPVPTNPPPKLVTSGPYGYVRNPMLTGIFIALFGFGFLSRSISLVAIFTPLFILIMVLELKLIEEPELEKRLGKEYLEYKKRVPMFIPWFKKEKT